MNLSTASFVRVGTKLNISKVVLLVIPGFGLVIAILILLLVIWPRFSEVLKLRAENRQLAERLASMETKVKTLEGFDKSVLEVQLAVAEQLLPSDKAVFAFVRQIEMAAAGAGIILNKLDVSPGSLSGVDVPTAGITPSASGAGGASTSTTDQLAGFKVPIRIGITGDYRSTLAFLNTLASLSRVNGIGDLSLTSSSSAGEAALLKSALSIDAYFKPLPSELGSIESPIVDLTASEKALIEKVKVTTATPSIPIPSVPSVPTGKTDIFAPF